MAKLFKKLFAPLQKNSRDCGCDQDGKKNDKKEKDKDNQLIKERLKSLGYL